MAIASGASSTQTIPRVSVVEPGSRHTVGRLPVAIGGLVLVVGGALTQLIALVAAPWWQATVQGTDVRLGFADLAPQTWRGFAHIYFGWGAWLILGLTLGLGVAGCVHWSGAHAFRIVGALFGVAAVFAPIAALLVFAYQSENEAFHVVRDYGVGVYLAVLGTMAAALGTAAGGAR
jgi:hypothetical protein